MRTLLLAAAISLQAQTSSTVSLSNGVQIEVTAEFGHPTGQERLTVELARASGSSFYRIFRDQNNLAVYAYRLDIQQNADGTAIRATAKPAEKQFAARYPDADGGKPVPTLSSDHELGPLSSGKSATLGLFEIPGMGLQVSDTIRVKLNQDKAGTGALRFDNLQVSVNGTLVSGPQPASVTGRYTMFYIPGRGGFFFATGPVAGQPFFVAGTITGNRMKFTVNNDTFDCVASAPILERGGTSDLWVYYDPSYKPSGNWTEDLSNHLGNHLGNPGSGFFTAASDSPNWWLPAQ